MVAQQLSSSWPMAAQQLSSSWPMAAQQLPSSWPWCTVPAQPCSSPAALSRAQCKEQSRTRCTPAGHDAHPQDTMHTRRTRCTSCTPSDHPGVGAAINSRCAHPWAAHTHSGVTTPTLLSRGLPAVWSNVCTLQELLHGVRVCTMAAVVPSPSLGTSAEPQFPPGTTSTALGEPGNGSTWCAEKQHTSPRCHGNASFKANE